MSQINDDAIGVVFCNWNTAEQLIEKSPEIWDALVISRYLDDGEAIVVEKDEFLKWLRE